MQPETSRYPRASVVSSFLITKGALVDETYTVLKSWDFNRSRNENLAHMRETNSIGGSSADWLRDVYKVLHRRFEPNGRDRALALLAKQGVSYDLFKPILLWHITRDEFLLRDFLLHWLFPRLQQGIVRVRTSDVLPYLKELHPKGRIQAPWTQSTEARIAGGLLKMAVDFELMKGTVTREFIPYHLPENAFLFVLHAMAELESNPRNLVHSPDWRLFLMDTPDVERELLRLHQFRRLRYEAAGSLVELKLPFSSAEAFIRGTV